MYISPGKLLRNGPYSGGPIVPVLLPCIGRISAQADDGAPFGIAFTTATNSEMLISIV